MWVVSAAGCAKAQARVPDGPPLNMPAPPERVIVALEDPAPQQVPEEKPPAAPATATPMPPPIPRPAPKPEPRPAPSAAGVPESKPAEPRTLKPRDRTESERSIRDRLGAAARDLARVDVRRLSGARRVQYDQSKGFIEQAEQAIQERNFVFAATLADKAAALAAELTGR